MVPFVLRRPLSNLLTVCGFAAVSVLVAASAAPGARAESVMERMTRLARAGETRCTDPWTYSRGLDKCICIKTGYSKQWGQCLPMSPDLASNTSDTGRAETGAALPPATTGSLPETASGSESKGRESSSSVSAPANPPLDANADTGIDAVAQSDPSSTMERMARAQDCLASLGLYEGAVDGEGNDATVAAYERFATDRGLPGGDALMSIRAQTALQGACGQRWVSAKAD